VVYHRSRSTQRALQLQCLPLAEREYTTKPKIVKKLEGR
jgi:hypothetical protein